jgi:hypothetical protein
VIAQISGVVILQFEQEKRDSSATSYSTIKAKGCGGKTRERRAFISLALDPCQKSGFPSHPIRYEHNS